MQRFTLKKNNFFLTTCLTLVAFLFVVNEGSGQLYWRTDGTSGSWTGNNWSNPATPTGGSAWVPSTNTIFSENSTVTFATTTIGDVTVDAGKTVNITNLNTLTYGGVRTFTIGTGSTLNWTSQNITANSSGGLIKNGSGILNINALNYTTLTGGFTLNNGTLIVSGSKSLGSANLTINGGTLQSNGSNSFIITGLTIGGDFTLSGTGTDIYAVPVSLGSTTRTITNSTSSGSRNFSGIISGNSAVGLTVDGSGSGTVILSGANTYTGLTTVSSGTLQLNRTAGTTIPITNNVTVNGGTLRISSNQSLNNLTVASGAVLTVDAGVTLTVNGIYDLFSNNSGSAGTIVINGTLRINQGAWAGSTGTFTYGVSSTLIYNHNSSMYDVDNSPQWPSTNGPVNVSVTGAGGINMFVARSISGVFQTSSAVNTANYLTINGSLQLNQGGSITSSPTYGAASTLIYAGTSLQTATANEFPSSSGPNSLTCSNTVGVTLPSSFNRTINGVLSVTAGTFTTGTNTLSLGGSASATFAAGTVLNISGGTTDFNSRPVTFKSDVTGTARLAQVVGTLSNATNVTVERYIPGSRRAFRFFSHPFTGALNMGSLIGQIFITGSGAGFDATTTNNPSAFWFNNTTNAWVAFTSTTDNNWAQYRGIRVLVRGDRTQGSSITGSSPTPNAVTLNITGTLNTGNQNISVPTAGNYHLLGNPYPSPVNIGTVIDALGAGVIGTQYWVWDANGSTKGSWTTITVSGGAYNLAMNSAFIVQPVSATILAFTEANKTASITTNLFRPTGPKGLVEFKLMYNDYPADNLFVRLKEESKTTKDENDGEKLLNSDMNFYTKTIDNKKLSLDARPLEKSDIIKIGLTTNVNSTYKIQVATYGISEDVEMYLKDKFTNTLTRVNEDLDYEFEVNSNTQSQGENRFELVMKQIPLPIEGNNLDIKLSPNPVQNQMYITYNNPKKAEASIRITNVLGQVIRVITLGKKPSGNELVNFEGTITGVYNVELTLGGEKVTKQIIKQ